MAIPVARSDSLRPSDSRAPVYSSLMLTRLHGAKKKRNYRVVCIVTPLTRRPSPGQASTATHLEFVILSGGNELPLHEVQGPGSSLPSKQN